ncbi:hypothetical protein PVK06_003134 [Gossypium arboreum]|uniref:Uncharacterized protein n=1 Tax=Gossypium arboreum TaxID=29729 RepID=A0ABR0R5H4_GOSAR|nr:hypothetical protein PVK06_003134 [Gossypium arboreum]
METELASLTLNEEEDEILEIPIDPIPRREMSEFQLVGCFLTTSIIHFPAMKSTMANLWHQVRRVQIGIWEIKGILIGEEGKKRNRGARDDFSEREDMDCLMVRSRRLMKSNQLSSAAAKRQADQAQ